MASLLKFFPNRLLSTANRNLIAPNPNLLVNYSTPSKFSQIAQKLGIPEPPKKPVNGFLRFKQENKALQQAGQSQRDFFALIGSKWRSLSAEQKNEYNKEWETEIAEYKKQHAAYTKKLSTEQKAAIKAQLKAYKENREKKVEEKIRKNEFLDEGKPKPPMSAYLLFAASKSKNTHTKASALKNEWDNLSDDQKLAYKQQAQKLRDDYEPLLKKWEDKMMAAGKGHLVRKSRFFVKSKDDQKPRKKSPSNE